MVTEKELYKRLDDLDIEYQTHEHAPAFTVDQAYEVCSDLPPFGPCKNLFLKDKYKRLWLIVAHFDTKIALKDLARRLSAPELRFTDEQMLLYYLGVTPGAVTPFGLINDHGHGVAVIMDPALFTYEKIGVHPLRNTATTLLSPVDLKRFIESCGIRMIDLWESIKTVLGIISWYVLIIDLSVAQPEVRKRLGDGFGTVCHKKRRRIAPIRWFTRASMIFTDLLNFELAHIAQFLSDYDCALVRKTCRRRRYAFIVLLRLLTIRISKFKKNHFSCYTFNKTVEIVTEADKIKKLAVGVQITCQSKTEY